MRAIKFRGPIAAGVAVLAMAACTSGSGTTTPSPTAPATTTPSAVNPTAPCKDGAAGNASIKPARSSTDPAGWKSDDVIKSVLKRGSLRVGVSGDALLWGSSNPKNGSLAGYDVDVATAIASDLGVKPEFRVLPLSGRIAALNDATNGVDIVAERFSINCSRWEGTASAGTAINFSSAYYTANQGLLVRQDLVKKGIDSLAKLKGYPVCGVTGSTSLAYLQTLQKTNGYDIVTAADSGQCLVEFQQGQAAAISADETTLAGFAKQDTFATVVTTSLPKAPQQSYGIGLPPKDDEFTRYVNAVLEGLRADGTLDHLWRTEIQPVTGGRFSPIPQATYGRVASKLGRS